MRYNPDVHHRRSIRLKGYDYATEGAYFVTVCIQGRECLLGGISGGKMALNDAGAMVDELWRKLPEKFPGTRLDQYSIMPNHFHGIIWIRGAPPCVHPARDGKDPVGADPRVRPGLELNANNLGGYAGQGTGNMGQAKYMGQGGHVGPPLRGIVQWFKTMTTNAYIRAVKNHAWPPFAGRLWQRNYYERIIRNDDELERARRYIESNPARWETDRENPANHL